MCLACARACGPCRCWLRDVAREVGDTLVLQPIPEDDTALALCAALFEFAPGQVLPLYGGMNEFLSAVVACIEATVPFRAPDGQGLTAPQRLAQRVHQAYCERVDRADPGLFLSNTWLLIEESNAPLAVAGMYTVHEYRLGLSRMEGFLRRLDPHHVFHQYKDQPSAREFADLCATARSNIVFATDFLGAKIASIAIVEALALCTGTDAPIAMFLGEIRSAQGRPERVEDYLPAVPAKADVNPDLTASPITAFVYRYAWPPGYAGHAGPGPGDV